MPDLDEQQRLLEAEQPAKQQVAQKLINVQSLAWQYKISSKNTVAEVLYSCNSQGVGLSANMAFFIDCCVVTSVHEDQINESKVCHLCVLSKSLL